jgi:hypothetical protein
MIKDEAEKNSLRVTMTQLWEEVVGIGFYEGKTEWDVEIVTHPREWIKKLDDNGCLILKKVE